MSAFYDALEAAMERGTSVFSRRALDFHFAGNRADGSPNRVRLWEGNGRLHAGGEWWTGFYIGDQQMLELPEIPDGRGGESPLLTFRLGFLPRDLWEAMRADADLVKDRPLTIWRVYVARGEGLRAVTPLGHPVFLTMKSAEFDEERVMTSDGIVTRHVAGVTARSQDEGRSNALFDTVTDVNQKARAKALAGIENDRYARFVPMQQHRRLTLT
jgi:hypothetical protein